MSVPPPIPSPIRSIIFYGRSAGGIRLSTGKALLERVENAHRQAEEWLNAHPDIEILTISNGSATSGDTANAVFVTVWYRDKS